MNFNDGTTKLDLNKTTTTADASHESGDAKDTDTVEGQGADQAAMESAKRAQNRIHADEQEIPGSTLFTK